MSKLEIQKTLCLSTAHLPEKTALKMEKWRNDIPVRTGVNEYGYTVYLGLDETYYDLLYDRVEEVCPVLADICRFAVKNGCTMIDFDMDTDTISELPKFDW